MMAYAQKLETWTALSTEERVSFLAAKRTNIVQWQALSLNEKVQFLTDRRKGM